MYNKKTHTFNVFADNSADGADNSHTRNLLENATGIRCDGIFKRLWPVI
jgi:hypothetical protein